MTTRRALAALSVITLAAACARDVPTPEPVAYVGRAECVACHEQEARLWTGSHHDLAMQEATAETVLGDFDGASLEHFGVTSAFTREGDRFLVRTEGPSGDAETYEVAYAFGVTPLQQYLVAFPGGRFQVLPLCWDTRPAADGGQRWFHLYPEERIAPGDPLFWTGPSGNWNFMCAECHSTRLRKGYDPDSDTYATTWSEIDVSCEACHGPGAAHVAWAAEHANDEPTDFGEDEDGDDDPKGLSVALRRPAVPSWEIDPETGTAQRVRQPGDEREVEVCARCHSRREPIVDGSEPGGPLLDTHRLAGLDAGLYHADGQVRDEVYVYGSFIQSRMHAAGVSCGDCHDPHSLRLTAPGNDLCTRCHLASTFDTPEHHHHEQGTPGGACVECHMPETTYMVVDPRRDHGMRVPRPDLTLEIGAPNACTRCHADQSPAWAQAGIERWYGTARSTARHFGNVLHAGRERRPGRVVPLTVLARDRSQPGMARASAVELLADRPMSAGIVAIVAACADADPLVRAAAVRSLANCPPGARLEALPLLDDPVRVVRIETARTLATLPPDALPPAASARFEAVFEELVAAEHANADRASAHVNLAQLYRFRGWPERAEAAYRTAIRLEPGSVVALVNLADLLRERGRDPEGRALLEQALVDFPLSAGLHHALGLAQVRSGDAAGALPSFRRAVELDPGGAHYAYVYAVALHSSGDLRGALEVLDDARSRHPRDPEILLGLAMMHRDAGDPGAARDFALRLQAIAPATPGLAELLRGLPDGEDDERR